MSDETIKIIKAKWTINEMKLEVGQLYTPLHNVMFVKFNLSSSDIDNIDNFVFFVKNSEPLLYLGGARFLYNGEVIEPMCPVSREFEILE